MTRKLRAESLDIPVEGDVSFRWASVFVLGLSEFSLYFAGIFHGLAADDYVFQSVHESPLSFLWTQPADPAGHWRPLAYSLKYLLFDLFGESPLPWHLLNVGIHFVTVLFLFGLLLNVARHFGVRGVLAPLLTAFLIQIHPAAVQNVLWVSGFNELLAVFFLSLTAYLLLPLLLESGGFSIGRTAAALLSFGGALLSKESAVAFPFVLFLLLLLSVNAPALDSLRGILKRNRPIALGLVILPLLFLLAYGIVCGAVLFKAMDVRSNGPVGILVRGFAMLVIPNDAMSTYKLSIASPIVPVGVALLYAVLLYVLMKKTSLRAASLLVLAVLLGVTLISYIPGGYVSLRLMYSPLTFFFVGAFLVMMKDRSWMLPGDLRGSIRGALVLYVSVTILFSYSAVSDWHLADRLGKAIRMSFEDFHEEQHRGMYTIASVPVRIRQAAVMLRPSVDFRGQMRQDGVDTTLDLRMLLRTVLLSREEESTNLRVSRMSPNSLLIQSNSRNQFFLPPETSGPQELPVGSILLDGPYTVRVLETILNNRPVTIEVTATPAELQDLILYDDIDNRFVFLDEYIDANAKDDGSD